MNGIEWNGTEWTGDEAGVVTVVKVLDAIGVGIAGAILKAVD